MTLRYLYVVVVATGGTLTITQASEMLAAVAAAADAPSEPLGPLRPAFRKRCATLHPECVQPGSGVVPGVPCGFWRPRAGQGTGDGMWSTPDLLVLQNVGVGPVMCRVGA